MLNPPETCRISRQEIFGPVVSVYEKESLNEAILQANNLQFAFQASVFSDNYGEIMDIVNRLDGSAVMVNEHSAFRVDWMPFAGRKKSGFGVGGIPPSIEEMSQSKMVVFIQLTLKSILFSFRKRPQFCAQKLIWHETYALGI